MIDEGRMGSHSGAHSLLPNTERYISYHNSRTLGCARRATNVIDRERYEVDRRTEVGARLSSRGISDRLKLRLVKRHDPDDYEWGGVASTGPMVRSKKRPAATASVYRSMYHTLSQASLRSTLLVALVASTGPAVHVGDLSGQVEGPPMRTLEPPNAVSLQGFTRISSIRELPDGRVLLTDLSENQLYLLDFARERAETIGAVGDGPSEYRAIGWLFPLTPDSTLLTDRSTNRWMVIDGDELVGAFSGERTLNRRFRSRLWGVGASGRVLGSVPQPSPESRFADRRAAVLSPLSGSGEVPSDLRTVVVLKAEGEDQMSCLVVRGSTGGAAPTGPRPDPTCHFYPESEQALLFPDGWVALARVGPYRVVWHSPDGRTTGGEPLPHQPVAATVRERCAVYAGWADPAALEACGSEELDDFAWTDEIPPFPTDQIDACRGCRGLVADASPPLLATPEGHLLIRRTPTAELSDTRYDLVDRGGALISTIVLPLNEAIVGFGPGSVYTVQRDDLDLLWLRRHAWDRN